MQGKTWLKPYQVARRINCTKEYVYSLVRRGQLEAWKPGPRAIRISQESLEEFILKNRVEPTEMD